MTEFMHVLCFPFRRKPHGNTPVDEGTDWEEVTRRTDQAASRLPLLEEQVRQLTEELLKEQRGNDTLRGQLRIAIRANKENSHAYRSGALKAVVDEVTPTIPMKVLSVPEAG